MLEDPIELNPADQRAPPGRQFQGAQVDRPGVAVVIAQVLLGLFDDPVLEPGNGLLVVVDPLFAGADASVSAEGKDALVADNITSSSSAKHLPILRLRARPDAKVNTATVDAHRATAQQLDIVRRNCINAEIRLLCGVHLRLTCRKHILYKTYVGLQTDNCQVNVT